MYAVQLKFNSTRQAIHQHVFVFSLQSANTTTFDIIFKGQIPVGFLFIIQLR